jgi:hypothetical protein
VAYAAKRLKVLAESGIRFLENSQALCYGESSKFRSPWSYGEADIEPGATNMRSIRAFGFDQCMHLRRGDRAVEGARLENLR